MNEEVTHLRRKNMLAVNEPSNPLAKVWFTACGLVEDAKAGVHASPFDNEVTCWACLQAQVEDE